MWVTDDTGTLQHWKEEEITQPHFVVVRPKCHKCTRTLTAELDSYYGKDMLLTAFCATCRWKVFKCR